MKVAVRYSTAGLYSIPLVLQVYVALLVLCAAVIAEETPPGLVSQDSEQDLQAEASQSGTHLVITYSLSKWPRSIALLSIVLRDVLPTRSERDKAQDL